MRRRSVAIAYLGFTGFILALGFLIAKDLPSALRAKGGAPEDKPALRKEPPKTSLPLLPYDPSTHDVVVVAHVPPLTEGWIPRPIFWMRSDRLCVLQEPLEGRHFRFRRAIPVKSRFEDLLLRLAALRTRTPPAVNPIRINFRPVTGQPFQAVTTLEELKALLDVCLPASSRRPYTVAHAEVRAIPSSEPPAGLKSLDWPFARLSLEALRKQGVLPLRSPERIRKVAKRLSEPHWVPTPQGTLVVALFPVVAP